MTVIIEILLWSFSGAANKLSSCRFFHQKFQVPKMEVLYLVRLILGVGNFPYISRIHTAYIGVSYFHFRYLKGLVTFSAFRNFDYGALQAASLLP